jgi:DNA repair exonuclease SbcCD ATPase subunit
MSDVSLPADAPKGNNPEPIADALAAARQRVQGFLSAQRERIARIEAELTDQLRQHYERLERRRTELDALQGELESAEDQLRHRQRSTALAGHEHEADLEHLNELRHRLDQRAADLDARQERLAAAQARTENQRRRIADELQARRKSLLKVFERHQDDLEAIQRAPEVSHCSPEPERGQLHPTPDLHEEIIQELKRKNEELEERVAQLQVIAATASSTSSTPAPAPPSLSWELQKQRLLAALEKEGESNNEDHSDEHLRITEVVRMTDEAIRDKDREIEEMRTVLQEQSAKVNDVTMVNDMAIGAAALGQLVDSDPLINEQREHLQKMQEHWEEMLRQAEIELSMERAKLARDRAELDEKLRVIQQQPHPEGEIPPPVSDKPAHSRWLSRLGLADPGK